jgi:thioesterase domain-containing protein/acyl carrier protein
MVLDALPLTATGKLDRKALPAPGSESTAQERTLVPPRTATEEAVARIWCRVLGVDRIGVRDDFFAAGGHSLLAVRLMAEIEEAFDVALPLTSLFDGGTIEQQASLLEDGPRSHAVATHQATQADPCVVPIQPNGTRRPFYLVHGIGGDIVTFGALARAIDPDQPVYGLRSPANTLVESIEQTASSYIAAIRERDPHGPYLLGGYSAGGAIAYEMAQQLRRSGGQVLGLIALDCSAPDQVRYRRPLTLASCGRAVRNLLWWVVDDDFLRSGWTSMRNRSLSKLRVWRARLGRKLGITVDLDVRDEFGLYEMSEASRAYLDSYVRALSAYRPQPFHGRLTLLRARTLSLGIPLPLDLRWGTLARDGVDVKVIRGAHDTILQPPRVAELASALDESLRSAQQFAAR